MVVAEVYFLVFQYENWLFRIHVRNFGSINQKATPKMNEAVTKISKQKR